MTESISYIVRAREGDDCSGKPDDSIDALSLTIMEINGTFENAY